MATSYLLLALSDFAVRSDRGWCLCRGRLVCASCADLSRRSPLSKLESTRLPQILSHPSYAASPWETIRLHASNTLVKREAPPTKKSKAKKPTPVAGASSSGNWGGGMEVDEDM